MSGFYKIKEVQKPIDTGFGAQSTAEEVMAGVNMAGKTAIVTGGYSGIGLETVRALYQCGATVIVPARNVEVVSELFGGYGSRLEIAPMDLMQPDTIDAFADGVIASGRPVHLLINNAGIMAAPLARDARGYESQFATNHLGHFQLTVRLWEGLKRANGARVVTVSSLGHRFSDINYGDLHFETGYDRWRAYGQSKTANILFAVHLDNIGKDVGIRSYALHPGRIIATNLKKYLSEEELMRMGVMDKDGHVIQTPEMLHMKTVEQGAATSLFCATSSLLNDLGGVYCENSNIAAVAYDAAATATMSSGVLPYAVDEENAERLWHVTCELTGLSL